jgi:hypothetical protein
LEGELGDKGILDENSGALRGGFLRMKAQQDSIEPGRSFAFTGVLMQVADEKLELEGKI